MIILNEEYWDYANDRVVVPIKYDGDVKLYTCKCYSIFWEEDTYIADYDDTIYDIILLTATDFDRM